MVREEKKNPDPVDVHVGSRVRLRRMLLGMSQERLGENLGLTFQQIQKYEKGINRIGASRLYQVARALGVPVSFFFDELHADASGSTTSSSESSDLTSVRELLETSDGLSLAKSFAQIEDPAVRRRLVDLVKTLSKSD